MALATWAITLTHYKLIIHESPFGLWLTTALESLGPELAGIVIGIVIIVLSVIGVVFSSVSVGLHASADANVGADARDKVAREAIRMATHYSAFGVATTLMEPEPIAR